MARLNKRQLKKAHKKRIDQLFKNYDKELTYELLSNQLRVVDWGVEEVLMKFLSVKKP
ncbi:hypothetical protein IsfPm2_gp30c [Proteus phage Isf-Pm2]|nr:hypothetical protein IsfPm2_gp30c [Proteus phage Isf-Pm2]